ncbi:Uma2 family endonuclease [Streptomyces lunaelactis]|uniref:Uma2 family endonuclease n=1 Tax=Streptomyces lunaelactis TaxID=1535768 RepID=UPI001585316C|nr:Uma2 family endonuclease [Streptomyces lunaelactis]NUL06075.1 Uma2 family endonuclease [Streptomyces lunaelactis]
MTVVESGRIDMADMSNELTLDMMFEWIEKMPIPEGYKTEIVGGNIIMSPQRQTHWEITLGIIEQLRTKYPRTRTASDVRIDFPGHLNGFACDVVAMSDSAVRDAEGRWRYEDIEFVAEVISKGTALNDYGPKKATFATADVPAYLIVDPYTGEWHLHTLPKDDKYHGEVTLYFGDDIDLTATPVGLTLTTDEFPRD